MIVCTHECDVLTVMRRVWILANKVAL